MKFLWRDCLKDRPLLTRPRWSNQEVGHVIEKPVVLSPITAKTFLLNSWFILLFHHYYEYHYSKWFLEFLHFQSINQQNQHHPDWSVALSSSLFGLLNAQFQLVNRMDQWVDQFCQWNRPFAAKSTVSEIIFDSWICFCIVWYFLSSTFAPSGGNNLSYPRPIKPSYLSGSFSLVIVLSAPKLSGLKDNIESKLRIEVTDDQRDKVCLFVIKMCDVYIK